MNPAQPEQTVKGPSFYSKIMDNSAIKAATSKESISLHIFFFFLFLAFIGINIFGYLAMGTDYLSQIVIPTLVYLNALFTYFFAETLKFFGSGIVAGGNVLENTIPQSSTNLKDVVNHPYDKPQLKAEADLSKSKAGWCFTGEDPNTRQNNCIQVGDFDKCMSGIVFSSFLILKTFFK